MLIPITLTKDAPDPIFAGPNYVDNVRRHCARLLELYHRAEKLKTMFLPESDKRAKMHNKPLIPELRGVEHEMGKLLKHTDYAAMTMTSFPDADIRAYAAFDEYKNTLDKPILVRGIVAGDHIKFAQQHGTGFYFIETGYFGNYSCEGNPNARKFWHRIVKNSMQHEVIYNVPGDRLEALSRYDSRLKWKGWKKQGSKILIVAPAHKPCKFYGINKDEWLANTITELKKYTDREIVIREKGSRTERTSSNVIYDAFDQDIYAVVTYNSIAAAEAVAYGIPSFAMAPTCAKPVSLSDLSKIETPYYPDPDFVYKWLSSLAYGQYNIQELLTGKAWRLVLENEQRETISY
jgi:hypothetical protein